MVGQGKINIPHQRSEGQGGRSATRHSEKHNKYPFAIYLHLFPNFFFQQFLANYFLCLQVFLASSSLLFYLHVIGDCIG
jgi:hypothetical protein